MPHCQTFKQRIKEIQSKADPLEALLLEYKKTGDEEIAEKFEENLIEIEGFIKEFKQEYETKVKELLSEWYPKKYELNEFLQDIKINEKGRVEIEVLDLSYGGLSGPLYVPSLFEKIGRLYCFSNNKLTSLPELPDGLKELDCSNNQLTFLPELPDRLQVFYCFNNQLTSLPKLPDGLKELNCSHNQLTSLPKLPDGLKRLYCYNNPFSQKTIERIKSHPNYDDGIWEI